ncbi:MAG: hypothetical protein CM15mP128_5100 [Methanobacteriota archaeon]|nr:MAG: hypothetical protein CM15mP128_5100 [Euryarchaeota archaeon]
MGGTPQIALMMLVRSSDGVWPRPLSNGGGSPFACRSWVGQGPFGAPLSLPSTPASWPLFAAGWGAHRCRSAGRRGVRYGLVSWASRSALMATLPDTKRGGAAPQVSARAIAMLGLEGGVEHIPRGPGSPTVAATVGWFLSSGWPWAQHGCWRPQVSLAVAGLASGSPWFFCPWSGADPGCKPPVARGCSRSAPCPAQGLSPRPRPPQGLAFWLSQTWCSAWLRCSSCCPARGVWDVGGHRCGPPGSHGAGHGGIPPLLSPRLAWTHKPKPRGPWGGGRGRDAHAVAGCPAGGSFGGGFDVHGFVDGLDPSSVVA